jgi:glycosyltransferase involved in cell wall biosynthesis
MNILWISEYPPDKGGIGDYSKNIVEQLAKDENKVDLLTSSSESPSSEIENLRYVGKAPETSGREWREYLNSENYDIICYQFPGIRSVGISKFRLIGRMNAPNVMVCHESPVRKILIPLLSLFDNFAFLSNIAEEEFRNSHKLIPNLSNIHRLPYQGVDPELERRLDDEGIETDLDGERISVVCPGFIVERKNYHRVAECFDRVLEEFPDAELVFAGGKHRNSEGEYMEKVENIIEENNIEENARITGLLESEMHVYEYIREADVVILPYERINQSGILARSLGLGTPTVVSDIPGLREPVEKYGGRVSENNLASSIVSEIESPTEIDSEAVKEDMSWEKNIEAYEKMFREISQ